MNATRARQAACHPSGGLANVELVFDGAEMSVYGKNLNVFAKQAFKGTIDELIDTLRLDFGLELPAADLLSANPNDIMMLNVTDAQALGTGVMPRAGLRSSCLPHRRCRLADLDRTGRQALPLPLHDHQQDDRAGTVLRHHYLGLEERCGGVAKDDYKLVPAAGATKSTSASWGRWMRYRCRRPKEPPNEDPQALSGAGLAFAFIAVTSNLPPAVSIGFFKLVKMPMRHGRPATPGSVAGVARRTTRRVIRRGAYIGAIPRAVLWQLLWL